MHMKKFNMKKSKKLLITLVTVITFGILIAIGFGANYLYNLALNPDTPKDFIFNADHNVSTEPIKQDQTSGTTSIDDTTWLLEESNYEDSYITSSDGLKLHNYLIRNDSSNKWVIAVHGYTSEGKLMASYARKFYELGYNVILPDLRGHGQSEGDYIGMGWDERLDIIDIIQSIVENDADSEIVLFGVSMGAATVMNVSGEKLPSNVKAIIEDCGYTSAWDEFSYQLKELYGLPAFPMMHSASLISKIRAGYWLGDASSINQVKKSKTPMLFIHGDADTFVPYEMLDELYNNANVEKEKLVIPNAGHAKSKDVDPELYWTTVIDFITKYIE